MDAQPAFENEFSTTLPVMIFTRPKGESGADWQEFDHGEGTHRLPEGQEVSVRIHNIDDNDLARLVKDLAELDSLVYLNLSENRKITNEGLERLKGLPRLTALNLSSCSITNEGLLFLKALGKLETLDLSYCNRITDTGLKALKGLPRLAYLDVRGCVKVTTAGLARLRHTGLTIHR